MKSVQPIAAVFLALASLLLVSCQSGDGPLLINVSGQPARLVIHADTGDTFDGTCDNQDAVWVGKRGAKTTRVEVELPTARYVLEGEELTVPYGKDHTTAFLIEATGPRKLTLDEAEILLRNRPK